MSTLQSLTNDFKKLSADLVAEKQQRSAVESSEAYESLTAQIDALTKERDKLFAGIVDSQEAYDDVKAELIELFAKQKLTEYGGVVAKLRQSKSVDVNQVLNVLQGDVGTLLEFAKIPQKTLNEFAALPSNRAIKFDLKKCIVETGVKVVGVEVSPDVIS